MIDYNNTKMDMELLTVLREMSIKDTMQVFEKNLQKQVYVVDINNVVVGAVSDGDVRRAILSGTDISTNVEEIMNENFKFINISQPKSDALNIMKEYKLSNVPILNFDGVLIGVVDFNGIINPSRHSNRVYIMAGGLGTRLRPLTENTPKPMLYLGTRPILEIIIKRLNEQGFFKFTIVVNFLAEQIVEYFGNGESLGVDIKYLHEGKPMGTCGALSLIDLDKVDEPILVTNGDLLTDIDYSKILEFHELNECDAVMCVREENFSVPFGVVLTEKTNFRSIEEKPEKKYDINAGIYVLNKNILKLIPNNTKFDIPELFNLAAEAKTNVKVYKTSAFWLDIGRRDQYNRAVEMFS